MALFDLFKKNPRLTQEQLKWNKMWELWVEGKVESPYAELMTYQSEINNGGHGQYLPTLKTQAIYKKRWLIWKPSCQQNSKTICNKHIKPIW